MRRILAVIGLMGLLMAACTSNNSGTGSTSSVALATPSESMAIVSPSNSGVADACTAAFATVNASAITSLTGAADALDATIQACPTKDDWVAAARTMLPNVDLSAAEDYLKMRCSTNTQLSSTPICTSLGS